MKRSRHEIQTIMAHPHSLPSFPAKGQLFQETRTRPGLAEPESIQVSKNDMRCVLEPDHCFISRSHSRRTIFKNLKLGTKLIIVGSIVLLRPISVVGYLSVRQASIGLGERDGSAGWPNPLHRP